MTAIPTRLLTVRTAGISIRFKIFGIAISLLGLIVLVVYVFTNRLQQVNEEVSALAEYVIPITDEVAAVNVHALEQELHFERVQKLYEIEPLDLDSIAKEFAAFEERDELVDAGITEAIALSKTALEAAKLLRNHEEWSHIEPLLKDIEIQHQQFHDHAVDIFMLLEAGDMVTARRLEEQLIDEASHLNENIHHVFQELEAFTISSVQASQRHQQTVQQLSLTVAAAATLFGLIYATIVTMELVRPVRSLARGMAAVRAGDLDVEFDITSRDEVGQLAQAFNSIVSELRLKAQLEETFGKYVDPRIVRNLLAESEDAQLIGDRRIMTVFFSDVMGLAAILSTLAPDNQIRGINDYLSLMSAPISSHSGVIDKFIDTVVMGFWGPPFAPAEAYARLACEAALAQADRLAELQQQIAAIAPAAAVSSLSLQVGLATGPLVVGNMGSHAAKSYTVMGDTVNTASRLQGIGKQYGVAIVIDEATQQQVAPVMATRELDLVQVVGKAEPVRIYELLGPRDSLSAAKQAALAAFAQGIAAYRQQDWATARQHFEQYLAIQSSDRPAQLYLERITTFVTNPPPAEWQGIWQLTQK